MSTLKYRPEVDGLRAVAVLPVILFHAGVPGFSGGYIGVDVFFVISGYLITSILISDLEADRFSLVSFYERRARRILPALVLVILACLPFAWLWMLPNELVSFGKSGAASLLFISNVFFWSESGYFNPVSDLMPLLHTWSLAVEEQYYLLFPIVLALLWRFSRRMIVPLLLITIVCSLALAEWGWRNAPSAAFYLTPTRVWEILTGAVCAFVARRDERKSQILSLTGLLMILSSVFWFGPEIPVPSIWTAVPVIGTGLILVFASSGTWAARILSLRVFVLIGLISYSAYLWHQPLLAFARIRSVTEPSPLILTAIVGLTFLIAWLSWKYVEQPFRGKSQLLSRAGIFAFSSGAMVLVPLVGFLIVMTDGADWRRTPAGLRYSEIAQLEETLEVNYGLHPSCDSSNFSALPDCRTDDQPEAVVWGDSFAMHLVPALRSSATHLSFAQATYSQCGPIPSLAAQGSVTSWRSCMEFNDSVLEWVLDAPSVNVVVLSSPFGQMQRDVYRRDGTAITDPDERRSAIVESFRELSDLLATHGKSLVIVSAPAQNGVDLGICSLRRQAMNSSQDACDFAVEEYELFRSDMIALLRGVEPYVPVIWLSELTCYQGLCNSSEQGETLYRDHGHLSIKGAEALGARVDLAGRIKAMISTTDQQQAATKQTSR